MVFTAVKNHRISHRHVFVMVGWGTSRDGIDFFVVVGFGGDEK